MCENTKNVTALAETRIRAMLGMSQCDMAVRRISPQMAKTILLEFNGNNRKLDDKYAQRLSESIVAGQWKKSNDNVSFGTDWQLSNGQHRLKAIVLANKTIELGITFNVDQHFDMDRGKSRTMADNIGLSNLVHSEKLKKNRKVVEILNSILLGVKKKGGYRTEDIARLINRYEKQFEEFIDSGMTIGNSVFSSAAVLAGFFTSYINGVPLATLLHIKEVLISGMPESGEDKPIIGLRDKLLVMRGGGYSISRTKIELVQFCVHAVTLHRTSKTCRSGESFYKMDLS